MYYFLRTLVITIILMLAPPKLLRAQQHNLHPDSIDLWVTNLWNKNKKSKDPEELREALNKVYWTDTLPANGRLWMYLAFRLKARGRHFEARVCYENAIHIHEHYGSVSKSPSASLYKPLANIYTRIGDNHQAEALLLKAMTLAQETGEFIENYYELAKTLANQGRYEEAFRNLNNCRDSILSALQQNRQEQFEPVDGHYWLALADDAKAGWLLDLGRSAEALALAQNAYGEAVKTLETGGYRAQITAACMGTLGQIHAKMNQMVPAVDSLKKSIKLMDKVYKDTRGQTLNRECAKTRLALAEVLLGFGRADECLAFCQEALLDVQPSYIETSPAVQPSIQLLYAENIFLEAQWLKGRAFYQQFQQTRQEQSLRHAVAALEVALAAGDSLRFYQTYESSRLLALEVEYPAIELIVNILYELQHYYNDPTAAERAFGYAEQKKAMALRQNKSFRVALGANDPILAQRYQEAWARVADFRTLLVDFPESVVLKIHLAEATQTLMQLYASIEKQYGLRLQTPALPLSALQSRLKNYGYPLLSYFYAPSDSSLYAWKLDGERIQFEKINYVPTRLTSFVRLLDSADYWKNPSQIWKSFAKESKYFYDALVGRMIHINPPPRLIICPDGPLYGLPFDMLLTQNASEDYSQAPFLLRQTAISVGLSATLALVEVAAISLPVQSSYLGVVPSYAGYQNWLDSVRCGRDCVEKVRQYFKQSVVLEGEAASVSAFQKQITHYDVIHFYGHAGVDKQKQQGSIALTHPFSASEKLGEQSAVKNILDFGSLPQKFKKSLFNEDQVLALPLKARLAVLSACETGVGDYRSGEGILSLGRSFYYAGCQSMVLSLWKLEDKATADITQKFFGLLANGMTKDLALQQAKLAYWQAEVQRAQAYQGKNKRLMPIFWAGIVLVGNPSPLF